MRKPIEIPKNCPSCDSELVVVNSRLFCVNKKCPAIFTMRLQNFIKALGIKGLGEKTQEKLNPEELYTIFNYTLEELETKLGSKKIAEKLYENIQQAKYQTLDKIILSFGIELIGKVTAEKLASTLTSLDDISIEKCKQAGLGPKETANVLDFFNGEYQLIKDKLPFQLEKVEVKKETKGTVCITGKLNSFKTKKEAANFLEENGYSVVDTVSSKVNFLLDESNGSSTKRQKAESLGITIIKDIKELI